MAAVGCMESCGQDSEESQEHSVSKLERYSRKNGLNHRCLCTQSSLECNKNKSVFQEKNHKLNGLLKQNSFTKPSTPALRSRSERNSVGCEPPKRRRRSSRHDKIDVNNATITEEKVQKQLGLSCLDLITVKRNGDSCFIDDMGNDSCSNLLTPDASRSCTPLSVAGSCVSSQISKDSRAPDVQESCKETPSICKWKNCDISLDSCRLMDHLKHCHVEQQTGEKFHCLWEGCKVYNQSSSSKSWLDRHILTHSGDKPFKCIFDGCYLRFTSQKALERHVNTHFNALQHTSQKPSKPREDTPTKQYRKRRCKRKRPLVKTTDYFDPGIMERLSDQVTFVTNKTQIDLNGSSDSVTFHSTVIARRTEDSCKVKVLLQWTPRNVIPDSWVSEKEAKSLSTCVIPLRKLPRDSVAALHPSLFSQLRYRRHRRK
ncbi:zinc finger protein aebp2-like [Mytilus galloprovincialis]|uniref:zinc finger protein aebp2-like n=1 Tax=Mytilus galloprovincialis TaxID=29158 RepID=UPI003F7C3889